MGILRYVPRTEGVSTSTLIRRIQARYKEEGEDKPKDKVQIDDSSISSPKSNDNASEKKTQD